MPKLRVSLTQTTGEVDPPLREASTNLEAELDPNLRDAPDGRRRVRSDGQHNSHHRDRRGRRATRAQMLAIHGLATRHEVDLDGLLRDRYCVCQLYELSVPEARELLGGLKAMNTSMDDNVEALPIEAYRDWQG
jgi:hypothetical protein